MNRLSRYGPPATLVRGKNRRHRPQSRDRIRRIEDHQIGRCADGDPIVGLPQEARCGGRCHLPGGEHVGIRAALGDDCLHVGLPQQLSVAEGRKGIEDVVRGDRAGHAVLGQPAGVHHVARHVAVGMAAAEIEIGRGQHRERDTRVGQSTRDLADADVVLVGVSRCGKTPTCLYLAMQFGIRAANYPFIPEDFSTMQLPGKVKSLRSRLYGLTIKPDRLQKIRNERRPNSPYSTLTNCEYEVREAEALMRQEGIPYLDATSKSVEELATTILHEAKLVRRVY